MAFIISCVGALTSSFFFRQRSKCTRTNSPLSNLWLESQTGEGKRRNEFTEWHVAWLKEWHNYAKCNIWKVHLFFGANQFAKAATFLMLLARLRWQSKSHEARFHSRLAFFAQLQRLYYLPLLVGLHGITDTTSQKSANEEKMFRKITLPSAIIFIQKMVAGLTS